MDQPAIDVHAGSTRATGQTGLAARILIVCVRGYQVVLGPILGGHCKYAPTCSHYAIEALREHGALRGLWLSAWRVLRCNPFSGGGLDPVPPRGAIQAGSAPGANDGTTPARYDR